MIGFPANQPHWTDDAFDEVCVLPRRNPSRIYTMHDLRAKLGRRLDESPMYQGVIQPTSLLSSVAISVITGEFETILSVMSSGEDRLELDPNQ